MRHLEARGAEILDRNVRTKLGEIDIVACDGDVICFVEVRSRSNPRLGTPDETVGPDKQRRLRRLATEYMSRRRLDAPARFDVAAVVWEGGGQLRYIADAFEA